LLILDSFDAVSRGGGMGKPSRNGGADPLRDFVYVSRTAVPLLGVELDGASSDRVVGARDYYGDPRCVRPLDDVTQNSRVVRVNENGANAVDRR